MNIENTVIEDDAITFVIFDRLKNSKKVIKPKEVKCVTTSNPSLNVADYVTAYLNKTLMLRIKEVNKGKPKPTQLFLSWATEKPVSKQTLSRWLKTVLGLASIDTKQFSAHSYRGAGLSTALAKGVPIEKIIAHASLYLVVNSTDMSVEFFPPPP